METRQYFDSKYFCNAYQTERCLNYVDKFKITYEIPTNIYTKSSCCQIANETKVNTNDNIDISLSFREKLNISILMVVLDYYRRNVYSKRTKIYISI
jgi:hypothetical protein